MSQNYKTFTGKLLSSLNCKETENDQLRKANLEMSQKLVEIEKANILTEKSLRDCFEDCQYYKQIALKVQDLEYQQSKTIEELNFLREKNTELSFINNKLEKENYELFNQKNILESEIERLNYIIHQLENKVIELSNKNFGIMQKTNKNPSSEQFERKTDSF